MPSNMCMRAHLCHRGHLCRRVFIALAAETPRDGLANELWCASADAEQWWRKVGAFSRSCAVMSMLGYVIGLGDRHLDNILIDLRSGGQPRMIACRV